MFLKRLQHTWSLKFELGVGSSQQYIFDFLARLKAFPLRSSAHISPLFATFRHFLNRNDQFRYLIYWKLRPRELYNTSETSARAVEPCSCTRSSSNGMRLSARWRYSNPTLKNGVMPPISVSDREHIRNFIQNPGTHRRHGGLATRIYPTQTTSR